MPGRKFAWMISGWRKFGLLRANLQGCWRQTNTNFSTCPSQFLSLSFGLCFLFFSSVNSSISRTINRFCSVKITAQRRRKQVLFPLPHCRCYTSYEVHASKSVYTMSGCESIRRETKTKRQAPWMGRNTALIHQLPPFQNQTNQPVDK